jgi:hypothetical protein
MHKIYWSQSAEKDLENILFYLQENWEEKVINNFIEMTNLLINQIALNPRQFPIFFKKKYLSYLYLCFSSDDSSMLI